MKNKKTLILIPAILIVVIISIIKITNNSNLLSYSNKGYKVSLKYPNNLVISEQIQEDETNGINSLKVEFLSEDDFPKIIIFSYPSMNIPDNIEDSFISSGYTINQKETIKANGNAFIKLSMQHTSPSLFQETYVAFENNYVYIISIGAPYESLEKNKNAIDKIINSIKFK